MKDATTDERGVLPTGRSLSALTWWPETNKGVTCDASDSNPEADQTDDRL
jgi:hypothetical protein